MADVKIYEESTKPTAPSQPSIDPKDKGKRKNYTSYSYSYTGSDGCLFDNVSSLEDVVRQLKMFDRWLSTAPLSLSRLFTKKGLLKNLATYMLNWAETEDIEIALGRRLFIDF